MGAIAAIGEAVDAVRRNPVIILVTLLFGLLQIPQLLSSSLTTDIGLVVSGLFSLVLVFVLPFYFGGIVGMVAEALDGKTSLRTFLREGRANYVSIFGAYLLLGVAMVVYFVAIAVVGGVGGFFAVGIGQSGGAGAGSLLALVGIVLLLFVLLFAFSFFVQFFGQAIVLDGKGAVGGFKKSIRVVWGNKLSTLGYMAIIVVFSAVFGTVGGIIGTLPTLYDVNDLLVIAAVLSVGLAIVTGIIGAFTAAYSVAFYEQIRAPKEQPTA
ncbi:DUF7847 domain-containing protein [Halococcus hamelinensis]|uniref:DUF7847 domain-containing protein n=1 Tax=Halococcus hamelinensis TaxID=332168 RepID=UPI000496B391|nr:hypothetical protein [Halococcus hamelinensis]